MTPADENNLRKFLTPFADGELDVEQSLRVLEHMAMNPPATKRVMHQQQLRQSIARHFSDHTPPMPAELKDRLELQFRPLDLPKKSVARLHWIIGCSAAALGLLVLGAWLGRITAKPGFASTNPITARGTAGPTTSPVPFNVVSALLRTHVNCSRFTSHNHSTLFPPEIASLSAPIEQYLGVSMVVPTLDGINFRFAGAEPCQIPGGMTVHLLYRGKGPAQHDAISIFVQRDRGQLSIPSTDSFNASTAHAAHPLFVWRSKGVVYYLIGDSVDTTKRAAKLSGAPT